VVELIRHSQETRSKTNIVIVHEIKLQMKSVDTHCKEGISMVQMESYRITIPAQGCTEGMNPIQYTIMIYYY
jgi:hypothetical protein